jgi:hypothetical protein
MIKNVETQFSSYGPGLPSPGDGVMIHEGRLRSTGRTEEMKHFSFFVSPFTHQSLLFGDQGVDFSSQREGEVIAVEVRQYPIGGYYLYGKQ